MANGQSVLTIGMKGPAVDEVQRLLVRAGFMTKEQVATGPSIFGKKTEAAVRAFQEKTGLQLPAGMEGTVSRTTLEALQRAKAATSPNASEPIKDTPGADKKDTPPATPDKRIEGVDVSKWQGKVDWTKVLAAGKEFALVRVSDGLSHKDAFFDSNWKALEQQGLFRGAYQYFHPNQDVEKQAQLMASKVGKPRPGDLPPALDLEVTDGLPAATVIAKALQWLKRVEELVGVRPMLYTGPGFWTGLGEPKGFESCPLWVAHYTANAPRQPRGLAGWTFWQYTSKGSVPGITGAVDLDYFSGTLEDLKALARVYPLHGRNRVARKTSPLPPRSQ